MYLDKVRMIGPCLVPGRLGVSGSKQSGLTQGEALQ